LLEALVQHTSIPWIRNMYLYSTGITPRLLEVIAANDRIVRWLDTPMQHGSDAVLARMRRPERQKTIRERLAQYRSIVPDLAIRTSVIVGFPGETEEDFLATVETVERLQFDNAFVFRYSPRRNTPAAEMDEQLTEAVKEERNQRLLEVVNRLAIEKNAALVGSVQQVLCEGPSKNNKETLSGRTSHNKILIFDGDPHKLTGQLLDIQVESSTGFTLYGSVL
jgi:MiaB/RimO family radical SAM methylthiotransferase